MYKLPTTSLKADMILYEDIYTLSKQLLFKANTALTDEKIQFLQEHNIDEVELAEPEELDTPHYELLQKRPHFQRFVELYDSSLAAFIKIMRTLGTGLDLNLTKILSLRDTIMGTLAGGSQLVDYLYNLMPNENEITYNHCFNCGLLCYVFGQWLNLGEKDLNDLTISGFLFDIGKVKIADELLWKPDKLTPEEYIQMQHHIHLGYELLKNRTLPPHVISVMIMHHERCDGSGYPARLKEDRIDPFALIAAIADTYEAMTHPRAQRLAHTPFQAIRVFEKQGFEKYGANIKTILEQIASIYTDRRVCLTGNIQGRITEIHEEALSSPTIFTGSVYHDLRNAPNAEIIRMI